ncbi:hypothetical protein VNO77_50195 [Canavalia gladiata]|uniref:Uncharacterized protein n=1 Tax=Canavalia gladiata TaxID=3824 RepID=A0AAN9JCX6_CANGL
METIGLRAGSKRKVLTPPKRAKAFSPRIRATSWISRFLAALYTVSPFGGVRRRYIRGSALISTSIGDSSSDSLNMGLILILKDSLGKGSVTSISKEGRTFYYAFSPFPAVARANLSSTGAPTAYFLGAIPTIIPRPLSLSL